MIRNNKDAVIFIFFMIFLHIAFFIARNVFNIIFFIFKPLFSSKTVPAGETWQGLLRFTDNKCDTPLPENSKYYPVKYRAINKFKNGPLTSIHEEYINDVYVKTYQIIQITDVSKLNQSDSTQKVQEWSAMLLRNSLSRSSDSRIADSYFIHKKGDNVARLRTSPLDTLKVLKRNKSEIIQEAVNSLEDDAGIKVISFDYEVLAKKKDFDSLVIKGQNNK